MTLENVSASKQTLRAFQDKDPYAALGRAVSYLMTKPNFLTLQFGSWSRILTGQVNRKHYFFALDGVKTVGFAGWAVCEQEEALKWMDGKADIPFSDSSSGDSLIINAWAADTPAVNRFILRTIRRAIVDKNIYAKRFYPDGSVRPVRLGVNKFVGSHLDSAEKA